MLYNTMETLPVDSSSVGPNSGLLEGAASTLTAEPPLRLSRCSFSSGAHNLLLGSLACLVL